jgi:uncharacterized protein (DUF2062 family)
MVPQLSAPLVLSDVSFESRFSSFEVFKRINSTIGKQLRLGLSVPACQLAMGLAATLGLFPIMGLSTPLNACGAYLMRLNMPIVLSVNLTMGPLKLLLIYPFLRLGEKIFGAQPLPLSLGELTERFMANWLSTLQEFGISFFHASFGWLVCAPCLYFIFYKLSRLIVLRVRSVYKSQLVSLVK